MCFQFPENGNWNPRPALILNRIGKDIIVAKVSTTEITDKNHPLYSYVVPINKGNDLLVSSIKFPKQSFVFFSDLATLDIQSVCSANVVNYNGKTIKKKGDYAIAMIHEKGIKNSLNQESLKVMEEYLKKLFN
jgi:hypothetical protein